MMQKPSNLKWKIMHYANKTDDLVIADSDEMRGVEQPKDNPGKLLIFILISSNYFIVLISSTIIGAYSLFRRKIQSINYRNVFVIILICNNGFT